MMKIVRNLSFRFRPRPINGPVQDASNARTLAYYDSGFFLLSFIHALLIFLLGALWKIDYLSFILLKFT